MLYLNSPRFWTLKKAALRKMLMLYLGFTCALPMLYLSFTISTCCLQAPFWGVTRVKRKVLDKMLPVLTLLYSSAKKRCLKRMSLLAVNGVQRKKAAAKSQEEIVPGLIRLGCISLEIPRWAVGRVKAGSN